MIDIECNDEFLKKNIVSLFKQKKLFLKNDYANKYFFKVKFYQQSDFLHCLIEDQEIKFNLPKNFDEMFEKIYDLISNKNIFFKNYKFYPFKQVIKNDQKITLLSEIQNKIMIYLFLNTDSGIEKIELIKSIWPKDKDVFLNKLDTHLTNLKNQILNDLNFDLKFSSKSGILKLSIN
tara:strand:+ start:46 stop:576 length:531 start_codon:yes stop_codon:yes gene_type:complete